MEAVSNIIIMKNELISEGMNKSDSNLYLCHVTVTYMSHLRLQNNNNRNTPDIWLSC